MTLYTMLRVVLADIYSYILFLSICTFFWFIYTVTCDTVKYVHMPSSYIMLRILHDDMHMRNRYIQYYLFSM